MAVFQKAFQNVKKDGRFLANGLANEITNGLANGSLTNCLEYQRLATYGGLILANEIANGLANGLANGSLTDLAPIATIEEGKNIKNEKNINTIVGLKNFGGLKQTKINPQKTN